MGKAAVKVIVQKVAPKKAAHPKSKAVSVEELDSRGRKIGKRGARQPLQAGSITLTAEERTTLRSIASRAVTEGRVSAFDRAMALEVGENDVALGSSMQSFAMGLAQARRHGTLNGREFNYTTALFSPGVGLPALSVLWIERTA